MSASPQLADARWLWDNEPCRAACPVHTDAGAYVTAIAERRFRDAYRLARTSNPFPSVCGRVCAAPCESSCRREVVDAPVSIRALKRFATERFGVESFAGATAWHEAHGPVPPATGASVGIVGGGPAGLAAAHDLRLAGHPVTIYERERVLGGMMVLGIPDYRLARALVAREVAAVVELGVDVRVGCAVGEDVEFDDLQRRHGALFVAVGTGLGRRLAIPGANLDGVVTAVEFLLNVNRGFKVDLGERVVVVGGGNVAFDAARTALREASGVTDASASEPSAATRRDEARRSLTTTLDAARAAVRAGVREVTIVALESFEEMPAAFEEIGEAEAEGVRVVYRKGPHRVVGDRHVVGLETVDVVSVFDELGHFAPKFVEGSEAVIAADTVILAVGQAPDLTFVPDGAGLTRARSGGLAVDGLLRTSKASVWAGGDVAFGPRNLIDAIADGRRAAASIHAALTGTLLPATKDGAGRHEVRIELVAKPAFRRLATDYDAVPRVPVPSVAHARRVGFAEVEVGYDEGHAVLEARRCLRCFDNIVLRAELCILCGLCVDVCPNRCISIVRADRAGIGTAGQSALLIDERACIRCALCINRCPPSALVMAHAREVDGD